MQPAAKLMPAVLAAAALPATGQHLDFQLVNDGSGQIKSALIDRDLQSPQNPCPVIDDNFRVYSARLDDGSLPHFENFPGFNACLDTFETGSTVGFNLVDALRRWDGEDFDEVPADETMFVSSGGGDPIFIETPLDAGGFAPGFGLALIPDSGSMHTHVQYFLVSSDGEPEPGVYLLTLEVTSTQPDLAPSDPLFIVFADGVSTEEFEAAEEFAQTLITNGCNPADLAAPFGLLDGADVNAFITAFGSDAAPADLNGDGVADGADVNAFISAFGAGCP